MTDHIATDAPPLPPAVGARLEPGVGRLEPERDIVERLRGGVFGIDRIALCLEAANYIDVQRANMSLERQEIRKLQAWIAQAFDAHPNLDLDIAALHEAA